MSRTEAVRPLPADVVRDLEGKAGAELLGDLHAQRRALLESLAPLKALHGPFGLFDDRRKQLLEATKVRIRRELTPPAGGKGPTDATVEARAYADPAYLACLDTAVTEKIEYIHQAVALSELEERIRSRDLELQAFTAEARLVR